MPAFDGNIESNGFSVAPPEAYNRNGQASSLGSVLGGLATAALGKPQSDSDKAHARLANDQAQKMEDEKAAYGSMADTLMQLTDPQAIAADPKQASDNMRKIGMSMLQTGLRGGVPSKTTAETLNAYASTAGLPNDILTSLQAATGKGTSKDEAYTAERQDQIRQQDFSQQTALEQMRQSGENARANNKETKPPKIGFDDSANIDAEIAKQTEGAVIEDPDLNTQIRSRASELYQGGINPTGAVARAISELGKTTPGPHFWNSDRLVKVDPTTGTRPAAAAPAVQPGAGAGAPPAPAASARNPGGVYSTPRGPMKWTGTGWVPVGG